MNQNTLANNGQPTDLPTASGAMTHTDNATSSNDKHAELCKNCNTPLSGPFCHQCGQPSKSIIRFFGSLITELLEDIISLDSRAFRTFSALLFRPGFLTKEYVTGKRFSYVPPLRLFLITSIFCIFIVWLLNKTGDLKISDDKQPQTSEQVTESNSTNSISIDESKLAHLSDEEKQAVQNNIEQANQALNNLPEINNDLDPAQRLTSTTDGDQVSSDAESKEKDISDSDIRIDTDTDDLNVSLPFLSDEDNKSLEKVLKEKVKQAKEDPRELISDFLEMIPKSMLLFVPIFALIMRLAYPFARRYYIEHLIHAFHGHSFLFLVIIIIIGLDMTGTSLESSNSVVTSTLGSILKFLETILSFWIPIYYFLSLRRVYSQGWFLTFFKWCLLGFCYVVLSAFSGILLLILSLLIG